MLRARLKEATRPIHDRVEADGFMARLMRPDLSRDEYGQILGRMHGFLGPIEAAVRAAPAISDVLPDLAQRFKAGSLADDLARLGVTPAPPVAVRPLASLGLAMGTMYVLEGSTMGARLIAAKLREHPFIDDSVLNYFEHYGPRAGAYWQTFTRALDALPEAEHDDALEGARRTFGFF